MTRPADPVAPLKAFWNTRYARAGEAFVYGTVPNAFLASMAQVLPSGGAVLCIADGEGRNSVWLAQQGFAVSAIDIAEEGVAKARALAARARPANNGAVRVPSPDTRGRGRPGRRRRP